MVQIPALIAKPHTCSYPGNHFGFLCNLDVRQNRSTWETQNSVKMERDFGRQQWGGESKYSKLWEDEFMFS